MQLGCRQVQVSGSALRTKGELGAFGDCWLLLLSDPRHSHYLVIEWGRGVWGGHQLLPREGTMKRLNSEWEAQGWGQAQSLSLWFIPLSFCMSPCLLFRQFVCATRGGVSNRSWPLLTLTFALSSYFSFFSVHCFSPTSREPIILRLVQSRVGFSWGTQEHCSGEILKAHS